MINITKKDIQELLSTQTKDLKFYADGKFNQLSTHIDDEIASLAGMTKRGFDGLERKLDVCEKVEKLESQMKQVREALNL